MIVMEKEKEFREIPEWMSKKYPVLRYVRVASDGALKWFVKGADLGYVWSVQETCERFGYGQAQVFRCDDKTTDRTRKKLRWWLSLNNGCYFLRPCFYSKGKTPVPLHRIVAAAWVPNDDPAKTCVCFRDRDRKNVDASNLVWCSRRDVIKGTY